MRRRVGLSRYIWYKSALFNWNEDEFHLTTTERDNYVNILGDIPEKVNMWERGSYYYIDKH